MNVTADISKQVVPCWSCHGPLQAGSAFCSTCNAVQPPAGVDHFTRLDLDVNFDVDTAALDSVYFELQRALHPDRFATSTAKEKAYSQAQATAINDAYETIKDPLKRADYIIHIKGVNVTPDGCNLVNDPSILMEAMEVREKLEAAKTVADVDAIATEAREEMKDIIQGIFLAFKGDDIKGACQLITRLKYLTKLLDEVRQRRTQVA
ncbi:MAG: Fe-S protein assembly co-chaperone HscB [Rhodospirillaceae bacterium]|nr:Fe-S protein assembly co-chaperone HscB [Rhodospirillaceae bacterium]